MKLLRFIRALRTTKPVADQAATTLQRRLRGKANATILAQAEARMRRRIFQGITPDAAIDAAVAWATQADHGSWAR